MLRKITSMTLVISLLVLIVNSIVLYVVPEGRVAYWADWRFWGLTKTEWGDQHVTVGFLFAIAGLLHLYYNWAAVKSYLKNKAKEIKVLTPSFNLGLLITALVVVLTYFHVPPVQWIVDLGKHFKEAGAVAYGEPPYGHAELSPLKMFCQKEGIDLQQALLLLQQQKLLVESPDQTLVAIAKKNGRTPQQIYKVILPAKKEAATPSPGAKVDFPDEPKPGFGRKSLEQVCGEFHIDCAATVTGLRGLGLQVEAGKTIHEIAEANKKEPMEIFTAIRKVVVGD